MNIQPKSWFNYSAYVIGSEKTDHCAKILISLYNVFKTANAPVQIPKFKSP